jgi:hypothetical protein
MIKFLKAAFATDAQITAKLDAEFAAKAEAKRIADRGSWDEELGCWMGAANTNYRFNWIMLDEDRTAREDAEIAKIIAARQN